VYVEWHEAGGGATAFSDRAGPPPSTLHAHGHDITIQVTRRGLCPSSRKFPADVTILGSILDRYGYRTAVFSMMACLRDPNIAKAEAQVRAMLASAQVDD
jgi:hypothetical protein